MLFQVKSTKTWATISDKSKTREDVLLKKFSVKIKCQSKGQQASGDEKIKSDDSLTPILQRLLKNRNPINLISRGSFIFTSS